MKVGILAGGHGTRLAEETEIKPKTNGGNWRPPDTLAHHDALFCYGYNNFVIALGYKGEVIKALHGRPPFAEQQSDRQPSKPGVGYPRHRRHPGTGRFELIDTGLYTMTGGRIKRFATLPGNETFMSPGATASSTVDLQKLLAFHRHHGRLITMTAVRPPARYGHMEFDGDRIREFTEKPQTAEGWINNAFFVVEPAGVRLIDGDDTQFGVAAGYARPPTAS